MQLVHLVSLLVCLLTSNLMSSSRSILQKSCARSINRTLSMRDWSGSNLKLSSLEQSVQLINANLASLGHLVLFACLDPLKNSYPSILCLRLRRQLPACYQFSLTFSCNSIPSIKLGRYLSRRLCATSSCSVRTLLKSPGYALPQIAQLGRYFITQLSPKTVLIAP